MKKYVWIILILAGLSIFMAGIVYSSLFTSNIQVSKSKQTIDVPAGIDLDSLTKILSPWLKSTGKFRLAARIKRFSKPKQGRYVLTPHMTNNELINQLRIGKRQIVNVTFNNRNSLPELAGAVSRQIQPDSLNLLRNMRNKNFIKQKGFNKENVLLMYLPNTYKMYYNTGAQKFKEKMWKEYQKFWNDKRKKLARKQGLTPIEAGILASIIQKESTKKEELPRIAGVYLNRLRKNMLLQADPTVVYAYKQKYGKDLVIKRVLNKHKAVDSPYNTYKYPGLPPGPVCMPDIQAIEAVLHPEKHNYLYFVADFDKPGYHVFSKSLKEHNRHARRYHRNLNQSGIFY